MTEKVFGDKQKSLPELKDMLTSLWMKFPSGNTCSFTLISTWNVQLRGIRGSKQPIRAHIKRLNGKGRRHESRKLAPTSPRSPCATGQQEVFQLSRCCSEGMTCTLEKVLADAKSLVERLRDHDNAAEILIEQTTLLNKRVEAMKQYQDEIEVLNQVARHRPRSTLVMGIQQENRQIRELQHENKELRTSLEEHQSALELIMSKYREQVFRLLMTSKKDDPAIVTQLREQHTNEMQAHIEKINEMATVMRKAIEVDEGRLCEDEERIKRLQLENSGLRELLGISREAFLVLKRDDSSDSTSLSPLLTSTDVSLRKS
ncbi:unnamed protein product [Leuciscus chuanchicus]